jgi:hypothetical protein
MHSLLNPFKITAVKDFSVIADVILGYKPLTESPSMFWPISERRKLDLKKGESRTDLDNIEIVGEHTATRHVRLAMPDKGSASPLEHEYLTIERRY